jgi:hypothetical protein
MYYQTALQRQNIDRCRTYLASRLADRPVLVEIHRIYQRLGEMDGKVADLVAEYDRYLEREPENSMLLYLRGRIDPVPEKGGEFLKRAQAADPDNAYPWFAQGYRQRANGEFAEARKALEKASKLKSDDQQMRSGFTDVRFALREFDPLASELEGELETAPLNLSAHNDLMEVLTAAGKDDKAGEVHKKLEEKSKELGLEPQLQFGLHSQLHLSYLRGKLDEMRAALPSIRDPNLKAATEFQTRLESGELENLAVGNAGRGDQPAFFELLLSLACSRKGNAELAAAARQRAITALAAAGTEQRQAAELLKQGRSLDVKAAESILLEPDDKAILLTALAETCPEKKEPLLALAEKLNYRLGFPHRFLKQTIAAMRGE